MTRASLVVVDDRAPSGAVLASFFCVQAEDGIRDFHVTGVQTCALPILPALRQLGDSLAHKALEFDDVVKSGRTHLMDAVPVTLGQEFAGYAAQVRQGVERIEGTLERLGQIGRASCRERGWVAVGGRSVE